MKKIAAFVILSGIALMLVNCSGSGKQAETKEGEIKLPVFTLTDSSTYDFGTIQEGEIVEHVFHFRNDGPYPLILNNITSSCGCTTPEWPREPISPKAESSIKVRFNSKGKPGPQVKTVTVYSNTDPAYSELRMRGMVNAAPKQEAAK
jgi:hypothetical protein